MQASSRFRGKILISDKGRAKRIGGWTTVGKRTFLKEQVLAQFIYTGGTNQAPYTILNYKNKSSYYDYPLLYYCFVKEFDVFGKTLIVVNNK